jgi:hypothetical protein
MPVVLKIDRRRKVVYSAFYGKTTDDEVAAHRGAIAADPDFNPAFSEIVDFTGVTEVAFSEASLSAMAKNPSLFRASAVHIIVAPADLIFNLASKYKAFSRLSRPNLFVVRTRAEAYQLLPRNEEHDEESELF